MAKNPVVIPGPTAAPETIRRSRLVERVYAPRPATDPKIATYRLRKAIESGDRDAIAEVAKSMTKSERDDALEQIAKSPSALTAFSRLGWSRAHPRPEQTSGAARPADETRVVPAGPTIFPQTESGWLRELKHGMLVHFTLNDETHTGRIVAWGKRGARVVVASGDVAGVTFADLRHGVAPGQEEEFEELTRRREMAELEKSLDDRLYWMSPEERALYFQARDGA